MKHYPTQKHSLFFRPGNAEKRAGGTWLRGFLVVMFLLLSAIGKAQENCYLLGTDSDTPQANHASATLQKVTDGVFQGEVEFNATNFYVATKLSSEADDWDSIDDEMWCANRKTGRRISVGESFAMQRGYSTPYSICFSIKSGTFKVTVDFNQETILAEDVSTPEPTPEPDNYINEESIGGCYLFCMTGKNEKGWSEFTFTSPLASLPKTSTDGIYAGWVQLTSSAFTITRALTTTEVSLEEDAGRYNATMRALRPYRYNPTTGMMSADETVDMMSDQSTPVDFWMPDYDASRTYWVSVDFNTNRMAVCTSKDKDPFVAVPDVEPDEPDDINLNDGAHFTINLQQAGMLKQRLTNAVMATDFDLVDFLTVRGKMNTADFIYLREQQGLVSQLQYLDLSDVEIVYDDQPYYSYSTGMLGSATRVYTYYLSAENRVENSGGGYTSMMTFYYDIHRSDLPFMFQNMPYLRQCKLPKALNAVGESIFAGTPLEKITLPTAPEYLDNSAFKGTGLVAVTLPESVDSLGSRCFEDTPLAKIDISRVRRLGSNCFSGTSLTSFQLNEAVTATPEELFSNCMKLKTVVLPTTLQTIGVSTFRSCQNLISVSIPASVTEIGSNAFCGCQGLSSVTMADGVKKIGSGAFRYCSRLANMTISENLEEVGAYAFDGVPYVQSIAPEDGVKYIGRVAYKYVSGSAINIKEGTVSLADEFGGSREGYSSAEAGWSITSITLPSSLRILGKQCLHHTAISSINLPEGLERIDSYAFGSCTNLRRITIPRHVSHIGMRAFEGSGLIRVYYNAEHATTYSAFDQYNYDYFGVAEGFYPVFPTSLTRVIIGEGVKVLPPELFSGCRNLVMVQMASTVEEIGENAFSTEGDNLLHIDLPSSLRHLGMNTTYMNPTFGTCTSFSAYMKEPVPLTEQTLDEVLRSEPDVMSAIEKGLTQEGWRECYTPFGGISYHYKLDAGGNFTFDDLTPNTTGLSLKVPNGSLEAYRSDPLWAALFQDITTFDGASDAETIEETTSVSVSQAVTDDTDLSSALIGNVFVTLDTEGSGDGYDSSDGCLVINSTVSADALAAVTADDADDLTVKNQFNGLIFVVPASCGRIVIDCQTLGQNVIYVKIAGGEPQQVETAGRNEVVVPYMVWEPSRIFVYAASKASPVETQEENASLEARRRVAYANDNAVKIYGMTINVDGDPDGIKNIKSDAGDTDAWFDLNGRVLQGEPTHKGVYIKGNRKVVKR